MAKKPETVFWERIRPKFNSIPFSYWDKIQQVAKRASPDVYGCIRGLGIAMELKREKGVKPDPLQQYKLSKYSKAGGVSLVIHPQNWEYWYKKLLRFAKGETNAIQTKK